MRRRRVVLREDYLDGIMGMTVEKPTEYDEEVRLVDAALLDALSRAEKALQEAEKAVRAAYRAAKPQRNPQYRGDYEDE
jgi:hypothetical protein